MYKNGDVIEAFKDITERIDFRLRKSNFTVGCIERLNCSSDEVFLEGMTFCVFGLGERRFLFLDIETLLEKYNGSINIETYLIIEIIKLKETIIKKIEKEFFECIDGSREKEGTNLKEMLEEIKIIDWLKVSTEINARYGVHEEWIEEEIRNSEKRIKELEEE